MNMKCKWRLIKPRSLIDDFYALFGSNFAHLPNGDPGELRSFREGSCLFGRNSQKQAPTRLRVKKQHALNLTNRWVEADIAFKIASVVKSAARKSASLGIFMSAADKWERVPVKRDSAARSFNHF